MKTLRFLLSTAPKALLLTIVLSLLGGAFNAALVALVHRALTHQAVGGLGETAILFALVALGKVGTEYASELSLLRSGQRALADLRLRLVRQLQHVPLRDFERLGAARVLTTLTDDVSTVSGLTYQIPGFAVNLAMAVGGACYLAFLSWPLLLLSGLFSACGVLVYAIAARKARPYISTARVERERLEGHFLALTHGMKELKLHQGRRRAYTEDGVGAVTSRLTSLELSAHKRFNFALMTTQLSFFSLLGLLVFAAPHVLDLDTHVISGYVLTSLYLLGAVSGIAGMLPGFNHASVALSRIEALGVSLQQLGREQLAPPSEPVRRGATLSTIELRDAVCRYDAGGESFRLGPLDLVVRRGELLFITGGNGSGKSTLAKVLLGLYELESGQHLYNGIPITDDNRDTYRQHFSVVFSDYYLFNNLHGLPQAGIDGRANRYLERLQLSKQVRVDEGQLSTTELSHGQRRRLALLTAFLEDRPIYLFDEWAADQDPAFKELFYRTLLPELRARGKTVIVVSHDDRYFDVADRRVDMHEGKIAFITNRKLESDSGRAPHVGPVAPPDDRSSRD